MGLLDASFVTDYRVWDGIEPITYYHMRQGAGGSAPDVENIAVAKRRALNKRELEASNGAYTGLDRIWLIPNELLVGDECKPGDRLQDQRPNQTTFNVLQADFNKNGNTWRLTTRDPIIAYNLRDLITVETPSNLGERATGGAQASKNWVAKYAQIAARMQSQDETVIDQRGMRGMLKRYTCFVAQDLDVTNEDRILFGTDHYDIVSVKSRESLDSLMMIECEKRPGR